jgi:hypothetical protein
MALLQALFSLIAKSAGKILNAIFGWAVVALFGRTSSKEQTVLSGLVGLAAAWPLLLLGIVFPKLAVFVLSFVPMSQHVPTWIVRLVWIVLAVLAPLVIGLVVAAKAPRGTPPEPFAVRALRGFPITMGIAGAFVLMFVTVPVLRIASAARGRKDEHVACITDGDAYDAVASQIEKLIDVQRLGTTRTDPSWWLWGPSKVLQKLGGRALRGFIPRRLAYWKGPDLEIAFYPSDILIRGPSKQTAWTHDLLSEELVHGPSLQTFGSTAQDLERQIRDVWSVLAENPDAHRNSRALRSRLREIVTDLGNAKIEYDDWQVVYRQTLQLARALAGEPQMLRWVRLPKEDGMDEKFESPAAENAPYLESVPTAELLSTLLRGSTELVKKEVDLAKAELRQDVKREVQMAAGLGVAGVFGLVALTLFFVAAAFALETTIPGWAAGLAVAGLALAISVVAGVLGWVRRVKKPLDKTERTLKEDVRWAKQRMT